MKVSTILFVYRYMHVVSGNSWKKMLIEINKERKQQSGKDGKQENLETLIKCQHQSASRSSLHKVTVSLFWLIYVHSIWV